MVISTVKKLKRAWVIALIGKIIAAFISICTSLKICNLVANAEGISVTTWVETICTGAAYFGMLIATMVATYWLLNRGVKLVVDVFSLNAIKNCESSFIIMASSANGVDKTTCANMRQALPFATHFLKIYPVTSVVVVHQQVCNLLMYNKKPE